MCNIKTNRIYFCLCSYGFIWLNSATVKVQKVPALLSPLQKYFSRSASANNQWMSHSEQSEVAADCQAWTGDIKLLNPRGLVRTSLNWNSHRWFSDCIFYLNSVLGGLINVSVYTLLVSSGKKVYVAFVFKLPLKDGSPASTCSSSPKLDWMIKKGMVGVKCILSLKRVNCYCHLSLIFFLWHQFAFVEFEIAVVGFNLLFLCWWWKKMLHRNFVCSPPPCKPLPPSPLWWQGAWFCVKGCTFFAAMFW